MEDRISLIAALNVILKQRTTVVLTASAFVLVAVLLVLKDGRTYSASSVFFPQSKTASSSAFSGLAAQFGLPVGTADAVDRPAFYADLVTSRNILAAAVETRFSGGTLEDIYEVKGTPLVRRDAAIRKLANNIVVNVIQKSGTVRLVVKAKQPQLARDINQRLLSLINTFNLETRRTSASAERKFTEARVAQVKHDLEAAEDALASFLSANRQYEHSPQLIAEKERLQREVLLDQEVYTAVARAYEQAKLEEVRNTPVITVVETPDVPIRPDPRGLVTRALLALFIGLGVGALLAFWREGLGRSSDGAMPVLQEFHQLRKDAWLDLRRPWRLLGLTR